jgi:SAM-dependent methyltransferase
MVEDLYGPGDADTMVNMDRPTSEFYDRYARVVLAEESQRSAMSEHFAATFAPGSRVLDVGAGSGRDLVMLMEQGFDAWGVEPNAAMRALALQRHPALAGRLGDGLLPRLGKPFGGGFDGIVCSAVLMHVRSPELPTALQALCALLNPDGRLLISLPELSPAQLHQGRDADGRLFANHAPEDVCEMLAGYGLQETGRWEIMVNAASTPTRWVTLRFT